MPYVCDLCNEGFRHLRSLESHKSMHFAHEKFYTCSICHESYKEREQLKLHIRDNESCLPGLESFENRYPVKIIGGNDDAKIHYDEEDSKELVTIEINEIERQRKLINHANYEKRKELKNRENESTKLERRGRPKKHLSKEKNEIRLLERPIKVLPNGKIDRRGRPRKIQQNAKKERRGRPKKYLSKAINENPLPEKPIKILPNGKIDRRGRPKKIPASEQKDENSDSHNLKPKQYCHLCGKSFNEGDEFKSHIKEHLNGSMDETSLSSPDKPIQSIYIKPVQYSCASCDETFSSKMSLADHQTEHINYQCDDCDIWFSHRLYSNIHRRYVHEKCPTAADCEVCNLPFTDVSSLIQHTAEHVYKERTCFCKICDMWFSHWLYCNIHKRYVHEEILTFSCEVCHVYFPTKNQLILHTRIHIEELKGTEEERAATSLPDKVIAQVLGKTTSS